MSSKFLGVGWNFPVTVDSSGDIALARYEESVRQSVWIILSTAQGERVMRPDFGCGIYDLVFAPNSAGTAGQVAAAVRQSLLRWEPRIEVQNVAVTTAPDDGAVLLISIDYLVRTTNNVFNLVYPFYLERTAA